MPPKAPAQLPAPAARPAIFPQTQCQGPNSGHAKLSQFHLTYGVDADKIGFESGFSKLSNTNSTLVLQTPGESYRADSDVIDHAQVAPQVPVEIAMLILGEARLHPLQLVQLAASKGSAGAASVWADAAHDNVYWAPFVPQTAQPTEAPQRSYATAFVVRYRAMSQAHRDILDALWWGHKKFSQILIDIDKSPSAWSNFDIVRAVVSQDGVSLKYAHADLRRHRDIVRAAVSQTGLALKYAHADLQRDRDIVLLAVSEDGGALKYAHLDLQRDRDVVLAAVRQDGRALRYAHADLQRDRELVLAAVTQDGVALRYAHVNLQCDRDVVMTAVSQTCAELQEAHEDLQLDPQMRARVGWKLQPEG